MAKAGIKLERLDRKSLDKIAAQEGFTKFRCKLVSGNLQYMSPEGLVRTYDSETGEKTIPDYVSMAETKNGRKFHNPIASSAIKFGTGINQFKNSTKSPYNGIPKKRR